MPKPSIANKMLGTSQAEGCVSEKMPDRVLSSIPWRRLKPSYLTNDFNIEIVEHLECVLSNDGKVMSSSITGSVECNARLEGTPTVLMSFNEAANLQQCEVHRCVRLNSYEVSICCLVLISKLTECPFAFTRQIAPWYLSHQMGSSNC